LDSIRQVHGVVKDENGAAVSYQILRGHPGNILYADQSRWQWDEYPAFNAKTGLRNVIHFHRSRRGETRGIPELAPVIEPLRVLSRLTRAELMASVVSALFTVFIKTETGQQSLAPMQMVAPGVQVTNGAGELNAAPKNDLKLGEGVIIDLAQGESVEFADPKRPNGAFDPFWLSIVRQIGIGIGIPYEVLIKHYTASYSAARAAIEDAWQYFMTMRADLIDNFVRIVYSVWMAQEVAQGTIQAPGFFADPMIRAAWLGANWNGPAKRMIDPLKEANAAEKWAEMEVYTLDQITGEVTGGDWAVNHKERTKENRLRKADGTNGPLVFNETIRISASGTEPPNNPDIPEAA
jgi:lambda family phage portal protein